MTNLAALSAMELDGLIKDSGPGLREALSEVERLRGLLIDIVDIIGTRHGLDEGEKHCDDEKRFEQIDDIAQRYYEPE